MRILFIGGTGIISSACSQLALERGYELYLLNRGQSSRPIQAGAKELHGDVRDPASVRAALGDLTFDAVVNWVAFTPQHIETDLELFRGRTRQYVFISSASAYQKPVGHLPITESTPLHNPFWKYSRDKIACEERLTRAYREDGFPVSIIRPSHTYDQTLLPMDGGYTVVDRMRRGQPVIVHGDGTSLWTLTHHRDFAVGFVGLLGREQVIGDSVQITGDEWLTWNQIFGEVARAAGTTAEIVHVPSEVIATFDAQWGAGLLGDKSHSVIFDNTKLKRLVPEYRASIPFARGIEEVMAWYDADPARQVVNAELNRTMDAIIEQIQRVRP
ncbi:SDR family oxidoreductase [Deinococcus detaillensis]|uniref:SDR family oxidoreductase n=1 Tax=Deinococcus detaillensis TaxID=2592048 RepID=A0A553V4W9_9DEIO|nr:SDR family oxidoreductase [Deinococcus detaillensis]TSA87528.1 SDR family oxidoreductase [Deinococcus detaillensis]